MHKYLGVDYGTKRIGLAIGDDETKTAVVVGTVSSVDEVAVLAHSEKIDKLVVGKPYSVANIKHPLPPSFEKFVSDLKIVLPNMPIVFVDERLSSKYADALAGDKKTKAGRDTIAAVAILQGYFDGMKY